MFHPCADFNVTFTELKDAEHSAGVIPDVEARLDAFMSDNNVLGCALGIVKNGEIHYLTAKGTSRLPLFDNDVPNDDPLPFTIGTPSSIGSISKTLTALGILKLVERGYIDLDRAALHYVPNLLGAAIWLWDPAVTVRQLLSHTSGLARSPVWNYPYLEVQLEEVFGDTFGDHPGIHPYPTYFGYLETPAVGFDGQSTARYSNVGYCILGAIIDYITRTKPGFSEKEIGYENFIWWNIGLRGCACTLTDSMWSMCLRTWWRRFDILNLAWDYNFDAAGNATVGVADTHSPGWEGPAGGWAMTIGDLTRLMIMIAHNEIISSDLKEEMMEPLGIDYSLSFLGKSGLGVWRGSSPSQYTFQNGGAIGKYRAFFIFVDDEHLPVNPALGSPEQGCGAAMMTNTAVGIGDMQEFLVNIVTLCQNDLADPILLHAKDMEKRQTAQYQLATHYRNRLMHVYQPFLHRYQDPEKAAQAAVNALLDEKEGERLIRYLQNRELEEASEIVVRALKEMEDVEETPPTGPDSFLL